MAPTAKSTSGVFEMKPQNIKFAELWLMGDSPLIMNKFSQKGKEMMLAGQMQLPEAMLPRAPKDPYADFLACQHKTSDGFPAIPGGAFKSAMVAAVSQLPGTKLNKTNIKQFFHVMPHLVRLYGDVPQMIMHVVRNQTGVADIRFRAILMRWCAQVPIRFDGDLIKPEQLIILAGRAGFGCGVGDWRASAPKSANGQAGFWHCSTDDELHGEKYSAWCKKNACDPTEAEAWGVVEVEKLEFFKQINAMPAAERLKLAAQARKEAKVAAKLQKAGELPGVDEDDLVEANGLAKRNVR